jgi:hypothetical protein
VPTGNGNETGPFFAARDIEPACSAEECSRLVIDWITKCLEHEACAEVTCQANELPCRLLDLKQREAASVVLIETQNHDACQSERYATLSHCWGEVHLIQTTRQNLSLRLQGIEWTHLPKTFQDAITIVRALGIRFLWIDSLCIVQNDPLEWATESVRMAAIYSNSYINIAATAAPDSRWGCFTPRSIKHMVPNCAVRSFPVNLENSNLPTVFVRPSLERVHQRYSTCSSQEFDPQDSQIAPLLSRAWVFQERQLAPRTLHFHPSELVMECKTCLRCECSGLDNVVPWPKRSLHIKSSIGTELLTSWLDVVEEYSKLSLSYDSDRLLALTGVATVFERKLGCRYLSGIWQDDIARGLLWDVTKFQCIRSQRSIRRHQFAPTWSWASMILDVEGSGIVFPTGHDDTFQVDGRFAFLKSGLPFAATGCNAIVPGTASLSLRAAVVLATAHPNAFDHDFHKDLTLVFEQDIEDMVLITTTQMNMDCTWETLDGFVLEPGTLVHCLIVGNKASVNWESGRKTQYCCALVLKSSALDDQLKERIGVLSLPTHLKLFELASEHMFGLI